MIVVVKYALAQDYINTAITYYNRGNDHYTKAEYDPAMSDLNEAIRVASKHPAARLGEQVGWGIEVRPIEICRGGADERG